MDEQLERNNRQSRRDRHDPLLSIRPIALAAEAVRVADELVPGEVTRSRHNPCVRLAATNGCGVAVCHGARRSQIPSLIGFCERHPGTYPSPDAEPAGQPLAARGLEGIRDEFSRWGRCADEFIDTDGWPHQLYVRDGRRLLGEFVLTERDLVESRPQADVVALGSYNIDIREVERTWRYLPEYERTPTVFNEGYLSVAVPPYAIPYRSLTPRREHCENLLVPVCMSASHVAFGSVRMEPTLMLLGHAAGVAAAQAARRGVAVQDVDVIALQEALLRDGQVLAA